MISLALSAFARLKSALWSEGRIYKALIRTILLYGCETWPVRAEDLRRLEGFNNDCLRCLLRCCRRYRVPYASLRQRCSLRALPPILPQRRLRWFGHASRRAPCDGLRWPSTMEPGVANDLHQDGPGPLCMVRDRDGCRQRIVGQPDPTRMMAASVSECVR